MKNKLSLHLALGLFAIAGLFLGYQWWRKFAQDPDVGSTDTKGWIAAVEYLDEGQKVVAFKADGSKVEAPGYRPGAIDKDPAWRPDGNRLFFSSDREEGVVHIFRWNLATDKVERRSLDRRGKSNIVFGAASTQEQQNIALITSGGFVMSYNPRDGSTQQLLPPVMRERVEGQDGGVGGQFEAMYERLGSSFKEAKWGKDRQSIVAVMRRDGGELLVYQSLVAEQTEDGQTRVPPPIPLGAGDRVEFDVAADGRVAMAVLGFQFPDRDRIPQEFIKNGVALPPYRNSLIISDPTDPESTKPILVSKDDKMAASKPLFSADGKRLLILFGTFSDTGQFTAQRLVNAPSDGSAEGANAVADGNVLESAWSPDSEQVAFIRRDGGRRALYTAPASGGQPRAVTSEGNYGQPRFSPQR